MGQTVDERIDSLLEEASKLPEWNTGQGDRDAAFLAWRKRAETVVGEKLGPDSELARELRDLAFRYNPTFVTESTRVTISDNQRAFQRSFHTAVGILTAAREASPVVPQSEGHGVVVQVQATGGQANADARANVEVNVSADELRALIATTKGLSAEERVAAIDAVPDEGETLDLERVDKLLGIATKSKDLLKTVLGFVIAHADHLAF